MKLPKTFRLFTAATALTLIHGCTQCDDSKKGEKVVSAVEDLDVLKIQDIQKGDGLKAEVGKKVVIHYQARIKDGGEFDSSLKRKAPFSFKLGAGQIIAGLDSGIEGMQVGGKRIVTIPSKLGYGAAGIGGVIPPNAVLIFEIDLLDVKDVTSAPALEAEAASAAKEGDDQPGEKSLQETK